jgi:Ring finger domain
MVMILDPRNAVIGLLLYCMYTLVPFLFLIVLWFCISICTQQRRRQQRLQDNLPDELELNTTNADNDDSWFNTANHSRMKQPVDPTQKNVDILLKLPKIVYRSNVKTRVDDCLCITQGRSEEVHDEMANQEGEIAMCVINDDFKTEESCCICLENFNDGENLSSLPQCRHLFHTKCIGLWIVQQSKNECPLCKRKIFDHCEV